VRETSLQVADLAKMSLQAAEASFLAAEDREAARRAIREWAEREGVVLG
jgi:hypothetical protein